MPLAKIKFKQTKQSEDAMQGSKLYVGNIDFNLSEHDIQDVFSRVGKVHKVRLVRDPFDRSSKGYGFVEMVTDNGAARALETLNGATLNGRKLRIQSAHSNEI